MASVLLDFVAIFVDFIMVKGQGQQTITIHYNSTIDIALVVFRFDSGLTRHFNVLSNKCSIYNFFSSMLVCCVSSFSIYSFFFVLSFFLSNYIIITWNLINIYKHCIHSRTTTSAIEMLLESNTHRDSLDLRNKSGSKKIIKSTKSNNNINNNIKQIKCDYENRIYEMRVYEHRR